MSKKTLFFWIDIALFMVLIATILTVSMGLFSNSNIHLYLGLLLCAGALLHLGLHWKWIKSTAKRFDRLSATVRSNAKLNIGLFITYLFCGGVGLSARAIPLPFHRHVFLGVIHACLAILVLVLQGLHINRHWKWIKAVAPKITDVQQLP